LMIPQDGAIVMSEANSGLPLTRTGDGTMRCAVLYGNTIVARALRPQVWLKPTPIRSLFPAPMLIMFDNPRGSGHSLRLGF